MLVGVLVILVTGIAGGPQGQAQPVACPPFPNCLYVPLFNVPFKVPVPTFNTAYVDISGNLRVIEFAIRQPVVVAPPYPVVIWSHGGANGQTNSLTAMNEWSEVTARAGYLTVSIAHSPRSGSSQGALCAALGMNPQECANFKYLNWDRPNDIKSVLDAIVAMNAAGPLAGQININAIAVAGHSAGSGGTMSVAGAARYFNGAPYAFRDARPAAFMTFSPQGVSSEGFFDSGFKRIASSWSLIDRPLLIGTGDGDNTCNPNPGFCDGGDSGSNRRIPFDLMPRPQKFLLYMHDADAAHTMFEHKTADCISAITNPAKCLDFESWLNAAALAFLDSKLRGFALAQAWLESDSLRLASMNVIEWSTK